MITTSHFKEAFRFFKRARRVNKQGFTKIQGGAEEICRKIIEKCWNGRYFLTSTGHFCQFYIRDFAICVEALIFLGYRNEVIKTLDYVLEKFKQSNSLATCLSPQGKLLHFLRYSSDSLPLLLMSIRLAGDQSLLARYQEFFEKQVKIYYKLVFDEKTGLVKKNRRFSAIKDHVVASSSCYSNCMLALLSNELEKLELSNPFFRFDFKEKIKNNFWTGEYFLDDLSGNKRIAGDAQVFPFWCGIFNEKEMLDKVVVSIKKAGLDNPMPLKYYGKGANCRIFFPINVLLKEYQKDTIWLNIGLCYLDVLERFGEKELLEKYLESYRKTIEEHKTFLELFNSDGTLFKKFYYVSDEALLWAAKYLKLMK